jgi:8-oxo-dGTP pyrophosphatase MutT (NUDIX family)
MARKSQSPLLLYERVLDSRRWAVIAELTVPSDVPDDLIRAAGGVVFRYSRRGRFRVAVVYREARGDWTFPKGKLDEGETFETAAVREVREETGMSAEIRRFIGSTHYTHRKGKPKIVAYYLMEYLGGDFVANDEVDDLQWVSLDAAVELLTWERDRELVDVLRLLPETRASAS